MNDGDAAASSGDIMRMIADLQRDMRELRAARRLPTSTIDASQGALRIVDGGVEILRIGELDGRYRGTVIRRRTGQTAFTSWSPAADDPGFVGLYDLHGSGIFTDDAVSGHGMATPWLSHPVGMSYNTETSALWPGTSSASWTSLWQATIPLTHPRLRVLALYADSAAGVAGQGRLTIGGVQVGDAVTLSGDFAWMDMAVDIPDWATRGYLSEADVTFDARRTGGTAGKVTCAVYSCYGRQS